MVVSPITPKSLKPNNRESFEDLCDRAGELKICMSCRKESHDWKCKDTARAKESDSARGKIAMRFLLEGHPSSDEDIEKEVPDDDGLEQIIGGDQGFAQQIHHLSRGRSIKYF